MAAKNTRICPHCREEVAFYATRCKHCGASLIVPPKRKRPNFLTLFFFLTSLLLGILCWRQQGQLDEQQNRIAQLEQELDGSYDRAGYDPDAQY